jgi:hypothetical protein
MATWNLLELAAWVGSGALLAWMILDAVRVGREFDEDLLLSSREGELEAVAEASAHAEGR